MHNPNRANIVFKIILFIFFHLLYSKDIAQPIVLMPLDTTIRIDKKISNEFNSINDFYKRKYSIYKSSGLTKASRANFQIEINTQDIIDQAKALDSAQFFWIASMVIAHEYAHLLQFEVAGNSAIAGYQFKVLEAQADIIAGDYLWGRIFEINTAKAQKKTNEITASAFNATYMLFFNIGTNTFSIADHPTKLQRLEAIVRGSKLGFSRMMIEAIIHKMPEEGGLQYAYDPKTNKAITKKQFIEGLKTTRRNLNIENLENKMSWEEFLSWSYDHAKLIVHGDSRNLADIVQTDFKVDSEKLYPKTIFKQTFKNIGKDTLIFKFETRKYRNENRSINITSVSEIEKSLFDTDNIYHKIVLLPRQSLMVADTFNLSNSKFRIVSPPADISLFYCDKFNEPGYKTETNTELSLATSKSISFRDYIELLTDALHRGDYSRIVSNIGTTEYEKSEKNYEISYNGVVPHNAEYECTVFRNSSERLSKATIKLGNFNSYSSADSIYSYYRKLLDKDYEKKTEVISKDHSKHGFKQDIIRNGTILPNQPLNKMAFYTSQYRDILINLFRLRRNSDSSVDGATSFYHVSIEVRVLTR
jgi:hypothetical protein